MVINIPNAAASCVAALATLKGIRPNSVTITDKNCNKYKKTITYISDNDSITCCCDDWCALAKEAPSDFTIYLEGLNIYSFLENSDLFDIVFKTAADIMTDLSGAEIILTKKEN